MSRNTARVLSSFLAIFKRLQCVLNQPHSVVHSSNINHGLEDYISTNPDWLNKFEKSAAVKFVYYCNIMTSLAHDQHDCSCNLAVIVFTLVSEPPYYTCLRLMQFITVTCVVTAKPVTAMPLIIHTPTGCVWPVYHHDVDITCCFNSNTAYVYLHRQSHMYVQMCVCVLKCNILGSVQREQPLLLEYGTCEEESSLLLHYVHAPGQPAGDAGLICFYPWPSLHVRQ